MNELLHIVLDPAHIVAEVVMEVVSYLTIGRLAIWLHDRRAHPNPKGRNRRRSNPEHRVTVGYWEWP